MPLGHKFVHGPRYPRYGSRDSTPRCVNRVHLNHLIILSSVYCLFFRVANLEWRPPPDNFESFYFISLHHHHHLGLYLTVQLLYGGGDCPSPNRSQQTTVASYFLVKCLLMSVGTAVVPDVDTV